MSTGDTVELTVRVLTHGVEVTAVSVSLAFDPHFLEVVDADTRRFRPGVQIRSHPDNPLDQFTVENEADNANGAIRYTVGAVEPVSHDFGLAIVTFKAKGETVGIPTEVVFVVENGDETAVSKSGALLLAAKEDFPGAFISIGGL